MSRDVDFTRSLIARKIIDASRCADRTRAILDAATPRPWTMVYGDWQRNTEGVTEQETGAWISPFEDGVDCGEYKSLRDADAELIVAAVNTFEAREQLIERLTDALERTLRNFNRVLMSKRVMDASETIGEAEAALRLARERDK